MKEKQALLEFGLSESEAEVYLILLQIGGSTAAAIARAARMQRTTAYPILKSLTKKGCVLAYYRKNRNYYYAQKPDKLAGLLEKKLDFFNSVIPLFKSIDKKQAQVFGLRFIETTDELRKFYVEILDVYKSYYGIGNTESWRSFDPEFVEQYWQDRARLKIKVRLLLSANSKEIDPGEKNLLRECKYLPEKYQFKSNLNIFDDKVLIVSPELSSSIAVVIAVPAMVDIFKSMFEMIWDLVA